MHERTASLDSPNPPTIQVNVSIAPRQSGIGHTVSYDPPPGKRGYQFPRDSKDGLLQFTVVTPGYGISGYNYLATKGGRPGMTPAPGSLKSPDARLDILFAFDAIQDGHLRLHLEGPNDQFHSDPQVGNDGDTRINAQAGLQVA
jgi:hypothetical protein